jgi:hypothetical protein
MKNLLIHNEYWKILSTSENISGTTFKKIFKSIISILNPYGNKNFTDPTGIDISIHTSWLKWECVELVVKDGSGVRWEVGRIHKQNLQRII